MFFEALAFLAGILAGGIASVAGFGIGSLLTPLFAVRMETKLAVAAVSLTHLAGTVLRLWLLRSKIDTRVLFAFGIMSALGGLTGALLHNWAGSTLLTVVFGLLLLFAGISGFTGLAGRMRMSGWMSWMAGIVSGLLGGLVGNQGGIRSAAMLGFGLPKESFVATATAIALIVDLARIPVYVITQGAGMMDVWVLILVATGGVLAGTLLGGRVLAKIDERLFRRLVSAIITILGVVVLYQVITG